MDQSSPAIVWSDVAVDSRESPAMIRIHLRHSKCDQFGKGVDIVFGQMGHSLCPVTAIIWYISVHGSGQGLFFQFPQARSGGDGSMVCGSTTLSVGVIGAA